MTKKYHIITFGCQMNKSDSENIAGTLEAKGYKASDIKEADLIVVNMCSVRQSAVDRVYGVLTRLRQGFGGRRKTILTGCILKKDRNKFNKLFDEVIDIKDLTAVKTKYANSFSASIPIMTGCNNFCSYCVVPYTRDREISKPHQEIICEIKKLVNPVRKTNIKSIKLQKASCTKKELSNGVKNGYKEIWLLGQNVNSYADIPFPELLKKINKIPGKFWVRFISSHPKDFSNDLIKAIKGKITPYLNLPVQAGDDKILKKMNRPYTIKKYKTIIKKVRKAIPNITISTDIIVGFPGETKTQFANSIQLFKEVKYDMAYINKYSARAGTKAANLKDNVSAKEKSEREKILNEILKQTALENNRKYINKSLEILVEELRIKNRELRIIGRTKNYKKVKIQIHNSKFIIHNSDLLGQFIKVKIIDVSPWGLKGKYVK